MSQFVLFELNTKEQVEEAIRHLALHPLLQEDGIFDEWGQHADIYFRGQASGLHGVCMRVREALQGQTFGVFANKDLQETVDLVVDLVKKANK